MNIRTFTLTLWPAMLAITTAACDSGALETHVPPPPSASHEIQSAAPPAISRKVPADYIGDEYADAQQALQQRPAQPSAPTF
jgi:hypothetical protein